MNNGDRIAASELQELLRADSKPCVSIFIPTQRSGHEMMQGPIRLKNLSSQAEHRLKQLGHRWTLIEELLGAAHDLAGRLDFWEHQTSGFAYYSRPGYVRTFRLPVRVSEAVYVNEQFHVMPLLPLLMDEGRFYVLAISEHHPRLYEATRFTVRHVEVPNMPKDLQTALYGAEHEQQIQRRGSGHPSSTGKTGGSFAYSTGPGSDMDRRKSDLKRYFDLLDAALEPIWKRKPAPVVLAGVVYELPIFRQACHSNLLLPKELHGNFDRSSTEELHDLAYAIAREHFAKETDAAIRRYGDHRANGRAVADTHKLWQAAKEGRVDTLFLRTLESVAEGGQAALRERFNEIAYHVLTHGGKVLVADPQEMPDEHPAAGLLRY